MYMYTHIYVGVCVHAHVHVCVSTYASNTRQGHHDVESRLLVDICACIPLLRCPGGVLVPDAREISAAVSDEDGVRWRDAVCRRGARRAGRGTLGDDAEARGYETPMSAGLARLTILRCLLGTRDVATIRWGRRLRCAMLVPGHL